MELIKVFAVCSIAGVLFVGCSRSAAPNANSGVVHAADANFQPCAPPAQPGQVADLDSQQPAMAQGYVSSIHPPVLIREQQPPTQAVYVPEEPLVEPPPPAASVYYQPRVTRRTYYQTSHARRHHSRSKKKSAAIIAGSAAAGAGIGAIAGGGKGAGIGAIAGGATGFVYDRLTRH